MRRDQHEDAHVRCTRPHQQLDVLTLCFSPLVDTVVIDYNRNGQAFFLSLFTRILPKAWRWALVKDLVVNNVVLLRSRSSVQYVHGMKGRRARQDL